MKNILLAIALIGLVGCGSETPLSRGKKLSSQDGLNKAGDPVQLQLDQDFFNTAVLTALTKDCNACHDNKVTSFDIAKNMVKVGNPSDSLLFQIVTGKHNGHDKVWEADSAEVAVLTAWINGKAVSTPTQTVTTQQTPQEFFVAQVSPLIAAKCTRCHEGRDKYEEAKGLIKPGKPELSELYKRPSGNKHKKIWAADSAELKTIAQWITLEK